MSSFQHDWRKAYSKATGWGCGPLQSSWVALRYALTGNSGRFSPPHGFQTYRIVRKRDDDNAGETEQG